MLCCVSDYECERGESDVIFYKFWFGDKNEKNAKVQEKKMKKAMYRLNERVYCLREQVGLGCQVMQTTFRPPL